MKTEKQIRDRLSKAYDMLGYYWSYLPELEDFVSQDALSRLSPTPLTEAELIVKRAAIEEKYGLKSPSTAEIMSGFTEAHTTCMMLEWVLDLDSPLARQGD